MDLKLIESNIKVTLEKVQAFKKVYDHEPKSMNTLPAATLFFDGFRQSDEATRRKNVVWRWVIRLYVKLLDAEQAQTELKQLILDSLAELSKNPTLNNSCLFQTVTNGEVYVAVEQNNAQLVAELYLEATSQSNF